MASLVEMKVDGAAEVERALRQLPRIVAGRALQAAVRQALNPMRREARKNLNAVHRKRTRQLSKSLRTRNGPRSRFHATGILSLSRRGFYGMFLEFGTDRIAGKHWFSRAFFSKTKETIAELGKSVWKSIEKQRARLR